MYIHIIDRTTAIEIGLKRYFTGKPCKRGCISERKVSNKDCLCIECKKAKAKVDSKYRELNKANLAQKSKEYREQNRETLLQKKKEYYYENKEIISQQKKNNYEKNKNSILEAKRKYYSLNKEAISIYNRNYRKLNKDKLSEYNKKNKLQKSIYMKNYRKKYKNRIAQQEKLYRQLNREFVAFKARQYHKKNPEKAQVKIARRRSLKLNARPSWYGELDEFVLSQSYQLCMLRKMLTGFNWHVDHMIPLKGIDFCGLHVWNNFQVIPAIMNSSKNNRLVYTDPLEWLHHVPKFFRIINAA